MKRVTSAENNMSRLFGIIEIDQAIFSLNWDKEHFYLFAQVDSYLFFDDLHFLNLNSYSFQRSIPKNYTLSLFLFNIKNQNLY